MKTRAKAAKPQSGTTDDEHENTEENISDRFRVKMPWMLRKR